MSCCGLDQLSLESDPNLKGTNLHTLKSNENEDRFLKSNRVVVLQTLTGNTLATMGFSSSVIGKIA